MADVLKTRLATAAVDVRSFDGRFGTSDGKNTVTVKAPGVLVAMLGFDEEDDQDPIEVTGKFFAACITRTPSAAVVDGPIRPPSDVCSDLASLVLRIVKSERWKDTDGMPVCIGRAQRARAGNDYTNALTDKGHSAWAVTWNQRFQLDADISDAELVRLRRIFYTLAMGPGDTLDEQLENDTPDIDIQVEFPEDP
jgi:hypothetical protein